MLHLFIPIGTSILSLKDFINIYFAVFVLNFILSHITVYVYNANSVQFSAISLYESRMIFCTTLSFGLHTFLKIM